jgi:predicted RNase H-like HicB family nuclease
MLIEYVTAAMAKARYEFIKNGPHPYYGSIPACKGVWATGATLEACRAELQEALDGWVTMRLRRGLKLPVIAGRSVRQPARLSLSAKT